LNDQDNYISVITQNANRMDLILSVPGQLALNNNPIRPGRGGGDGFL